MGRVAVDKRIDTCLGKVLIIERPTLEARGKEWTVSASGRAIDEVAIFVGKFQPDAAIVLTGNGTAYLISGARLEPSRRNYVPTTYWRELTPEEMGYIPEVAQALSLSSSP